MEQGSFATKRFGAIPRNFFWDLQRGEISSDEFLLGCYFVCAVDFETQETTFTLATLTEEIGWEKSDDTLRRVLRGLAEKGWIELEVMPRRKKWVVRLRGLYRTNYRTRTAPDPPSHAVVGNGRAVVGETANPLADWDDEEIPF